MQKNWECGCEELCYQRLISLFDFGFVKKGGCWHHNSNSESERMFSPELRGLSRGEGVFVCHGS